MTWSSRIRRRGVLMVATLALVLTLALSACGGHGVGGAGNTRGNTTSQSGGQTSTSPAVSDLENGDQQVQDAVSAMDSALNDASIDLSAQDTVIQP